MIQITKYGHAMMLSILAILLLSWYSSIISNLIAGILVGFSLRLARQSGQEQ